MSDIFEGPRLKVQRADELIEELYGKLVKHFSDHKNAFTIALVPVDDLIQVDVRARTVPPRMSLLLGDAIHNLRSALDHVAVQLVKAANKVPSKNLYFPVSDTLEKFTNRMKEPQTRLFGETVCDVIQFSIKPYKGGHPLLWALHQVDIGDKHHDLVPTCGYGEVTIDMAEPSSNSKVNDLTIGLESGTGVVPIEMDGVWQITRVHNLNYSVEFPADSTFGSVPLIKTLRQCSLAVKATINEIEAAHLSAQA